jgi:hypothetical protein
VIEAANIKHHWQWVRPLLDRLYERDCERGVPDWVVEDVYADCVHGKAFFYLATGGFVVLKEGKNPTTGAKSLVVWMACANDSSKTDNIAENAEAIRSMAQSIGADQVEFYTTRKGYARIIGTYGYRFAYSKYVMEV